MRTQSPPSDAASSVSPVQSVRIRRGVVYLACAAYLAVTLLFGVRHLLGDLMSHPMSYFFTWDMFPGYTTETSRRQMIGETENGRFVRLLPAANHHFRWGINGKVCRIDVDRSQANYVPELRRQVLRYNGQHPEDPVFKVVIAEEYWPSKFNLPDDIYKSAYGEPKPRRTYRRIFDEAEVTTDGGFRPVRRQPRPSSEK